MAPLRSGRSRASVLIAAVVFALAPLSSRAIERASDAPTALEDLSDLTGNQRALADYLNRTCAGDASLALCDAGDAAPDRTRAALDALDPSSLIDAANSALDLAALENQGVLRRLAALRAGSRGVDFANLTLQVGDQQLQGPSVNAISTPLVGKVFDGVLGGSDSADRIGVFTNGAVRFGKTGVGDTRATDAIDLDTGIDYRVRDDLAVGISGGYSHDPSRAPLDLAAWRGSLYGTYFAPNRFHVDALVTYGAADVDTTRVVDASDALGNPASIAKANAGGRQLSGVLVGAFDWRYGPWAFGPRVGAYYLDTDVGRLDETGAGDYDLSVGNQSAQSLRLNAGARLGVSVRLPWIVLTPRLDADYVHDVADRSQTVDVRLAGDPSTDDGDSIDASLRPTRTDPGYFVWTVGATAQWTKLLSAFVSYRTYAGADAPVTKELMWGLQFKATP